MLEGGHVQGDFTRAHTKAPLAEALMLTRLPKGRWPAWRHDTRDPVVPVRYALYGMERSDGDWAIYRDDSAVQLDWTRVRPIGF